MTSAFSWRNYLPLPHFIPYSKAKFACYPRCFLTSYFCIPVPYHSYPMPKVRGGGQEEQPHVQGAVVAPAQEGLEELSHNEGQEGWQ